MADVVEVKTGSGSTAHWPIHFIRLNGWLRLSFAQLLSLLYIDGIDQNWEDSNSSAARRSRRPPPPWRVGIIPTPARPSRHPPAAPASATSATSVEAASRLVGPCRGARPCTWRCAPAAAASAARRSGRPAPPPRASPAPAAPRCACGRWRGATSPPQCTGGSSCSRH